MNKVKITQEQADAIEELVLNMKKGQIVKHHISGVWGNSYNSLDGLNVDGLIRALYIGYEVDPEFVSFEEAMKALKEAKAVYFHDEEWKTRVIYGAFLEDTDIAGYTLAGLINGKWSIGRENK